MVINMDDAKLKMLTQIEEFLKGPRHLFCVVKSERYPLIQRTLTRFGYDRLGRKEKGILLRYIEQMTGLSRQQITRLVHQFQTTGEVQLGYRPPVEGFAGSSVPRMSPFWRRWTNIMENCLALPRRSSRREAVNL